jgi:hypothetical protein
MLLKRANHELPRLTDRLPLGRGLEVSPICLGLCKSPEVVEAAFDAGINFFFLSADMHWPLYEAVRIGLGRLLERTSRDNVVVAGAAYVTQPEFCTAPFDELIAAVPGLGGLDVLIAGGAYGTEIATRLEVFERHRAGAYADCRAIGASFHDRRAAAEAMTAERLDLALIRFNPLHTGARRDVFPFIPTERHIRLYNFNSTVGCLSRDAQAVSLDEDNWKPRPTDYYRYALTHPQLDGLLVALSTEHQVDALSAALAEGPLDAAECQYLETLAAALIRGE